MATVYLGNHSAAEIRNQGTDAEERVKLPKAKRRTTVQIPESYTLVEQFRTIADPAGAWAAMADKPPAWVASDSEALALLLAEHYGCPIREPLPTGERDEFPEEGPA